MSISKDGLGITSLKDWEGRAGPLGKYGWKDGRGAKEAAQKWLGVTSPDMPDDIGTTIAAHDDFGPIVSWMGEPEVRLRFDRLKGNVRNTDLLVTAQDAKGPFVIAIEAKADETFSETVANALAASLERKLKYGTSDGVPRIEQLAAALFGPKQKGECSLGHLRYQLLTASAGALAYASEHGFDRVVLFVEEFVTDLTLDSNHRSNAKDLNRFLHRISHGVIQTLEPGRLRGPITVPGRPLFDPEPRLYIGKSTSNLRKG
jgi:hypothetical protein